jgi:hypothetical protein
MKQGSDRWEKEAIEFDSARLSRRDFLGLTGTGLFLFFWVGPVELFQEPQRLPGQPSYPSDFNAYLRSGRRGGSHASSARWNWGRER